MPSEDRLRRDIDPELTPMPSEDHLRWDIDPELTQEPIFGPSREGLRTQPKLGPLSFYRPKNQARHPQGDPIPPQKSEFILEVGKAKTSIGIGDQEKTKQRQVKGAAVVPQNARRCRSRKTPTRTSDRAAVRRDHG